MKVAIIKYNAGNTCSVGFALERLGVLPMVTDDIEEIQSADKIIFPGVGEASTAMRYLKDRKLDEMIKELRQPVLGICLGMQLLCEYSEENDTTCLGVFSCHVRRFFFEGQQFKVPHVGWNELENMKASLFADITAPAHCYFVHSYYASPCIETVAETSYGITFSAALKKNNFYGVQFHPEKSADAGEQILKNFLNL